MLKIDFILFLLLVFGTSLFAQQSQLIGKEEVSPKEFFSIIEAFPLATIVDVRVAKHFRKNHLIGAINAPEKKELSNILDTLDKENPLLLYCEYGKRSVEAASYAKKRGFRRVFNLKGGILHWKENNYPIFRKKQRKRLEPN